MGSSSPLHLNVVDRFTGVQGQIFPERYFGHLANAHGFDSFAVVDIHRYRGGKIHPEILNNNLDEELISTVVGSQALGHCSLFDQLNASNVPFAWKSGENAYTRESTVGLPDDDQFDELLEVFDIRSGYCVPLHSPDSRRSVVVYFSKRPDSSARHAELVLDTIEMFERSSFEPVEYPNFKHAALSNSERKCLKLSAHGKTSGEIAFELTLSEHTVNSYFSILCTKLGAKNRSHAIIRAVQLGELGMHELLR